MLGVLNLWIEKISFQEAPITTVWDSLEVEQNKKKLKSEAGEMTQWAGRSESMWKERIESSKLSPDFHM